MTLVGREGPLDRSAPIDRTCARGGMDAYVGKAC